MILLSSRAILAHEHPTDLNSSSSASSSSAIPSFLPSGRRSKSSRHGSSTITDESDNSRFLERLISREEEIRAVNATLVVTNERLEAESSRANDAERRALDYSHRLRIATENCERAEQESARLGEELKLYKLQLDNAQREIFRAQDTIDQVASQRNEAEADAVRARTMARKLQEERLVMLAREEGRRLGFKMGLSSGREIGYDEEDIRPDEGTANEERSDLQSRIQLRSAGSIREHPVRSQSALPARTFETAPPYTPPLPIPVRGGYARVHTPSREQYIPSSPREQDEPETVHPVPIPIRPWSGPHASHQRYNDREKGTRKATEKEAMAEMGNRDRDSERVGNSVRIQNWGRDRDKRETARGRDKTGTGKDDVTLVWEIANGKPTELDEELTRSPAPLQRSI